MILIGNSFIPGSKIFTLAGNGQKGYTGDGGTATSASLNIPIGVALSSTGLVYIADQYNYVTREVTLDDKINTFAGNGKQGNEGDGGPATSASMFYPSGVAVSSSGVVYIADIVYSVVRVVTTDGIINTFAGNMQRGYTGDGGPAVSASLSEPMGIAVSSHGDVYIADTLNNVVRVVTKDGIINTFAGNGTEGYSGDGGLATSANLDHPKGVAVSSHGVVYIAESGNNVIRVVTRDGIINTLAGKGKEGYSGDGGLATNASINQPNGIAVSSHGVVYIADTGNNVIRNITLGGIINTFAGNGKPAYAGDGGPATSGSLNQPTGIAVSSSGAVYIAESISNVIRFVVSNLCSSGNKNNN